MTEADLIGLFIESSQALDSNFEFWLTGSFAVLVASYLVQERIPLLVLLGAIFLYVVSTMLFMIRGMTMGRTLTSLREQIEAMNSDISLVSAGENLSIAILYFVIMIGGTTATILFVCWRYQYLRNQEST